jgi:AcrR family transcriptional regulator
MNEQSPISRAAPPSGRPTREHAERRHEELLERALEMFAECGFEMTTIDAIANSLNMTKRTIYARYSDKAALFGAAMDRAIKRWVLPVEMLRATDTGDLQTSLVAFARLRVGNNMTREGLRLQRIVTSEAFRFPGVYSRYEAATQVVIDYLVGLFERHAREEPGVWFDDPDLAASAFLSMINTPARLALLFGRNQTQPAIEAFIDKTVRLFLDGLRPRA